MRGLISRRLAWSCIADLAWPMQVDAEPSYTAEFLSLPPKYRLRKSPRLGESRNRGWDGSDPNRHKIYGGYPQAQQRLLGWELQRQPGTSNVSRAYARLRGLRREPSRNANQERQEQLPFPRRRSKSMKIYTPYSASRQRCPAQKGLITRRRTHGSIAMPSQMKSKYSKFVIGLPSASRRVTADI